MMDSPQLSFPPRFEVPRPAPTVLPPTSTPYDPVYEFVPRIEFCEVAATVDSMWPSETVTGTDVGSAQLQAPPDDFMDTALAHRSGSGCSVDWTGAFLLNDNLATLSL